MSEVIRNSWQFSVRDLLKLMLIVSVILMIGILSRGSQYVAAFSTPWTVASLLPVVAVWALYRWQCCASRALAAISVICYGVALSMPAFGMGEDIIFGWLAWLQSFAGLDLFRDRTFEGLFGPITIEWRYPIACAIGAVTNFAYLVAIAVYGLAGHKPRALKLAHLAVILSTILAVVALVPTCLTGDLATLYPGYGLWTASMLALALATYQRCQQQRNSLIPR